MNFQPTQRQQLLREMVRGFLESECSAEYIREVDEAGEFPHHFFKKMADAGLLGLSIPEEYGGSGASLLDTVMVQEELTKGFAIAGMIFTMMVSNGAELFIHNGTEEQKSCFLPRLEAGELKVALSLTEPDAGSDAASIRTRALESNGGFLIVGNKHFCSGADVADYIFVVTRTDDQTGKYAGFTIFVVPRGSSGLSIVRQHKMGNCPISANKIFLDKVPVGPDDILGGPEKLNEGWKQLMSVLTRERVLNSALALGRCEAAFDLALRYAKDRQQFGQPIGKFQVIQHHFADMATEIQAARLMTYQAAWMVDNGIPCRKEVSMCKWWATELAKKTAIMGLQIMGGAGYMMESDMQRFVRDSFQGTIGSGTTQIQKNVIARELGL